MLGPIRCKTRDFIRIPKRIMLKHMYGYRLEFVYEMDKRNFIIGEDFHRAHLTALQTTKASSMLELYQLTRNR